MTWVGHKILSFSVVYALTGDFISGIITAIGSTIPDLLETYPNSFEKNSYKWRKRHRTLTHWFVVYFVVFFVLVYLCYRQVGFNIFNHSVLVFLNLDFWLFLYLIGIYMCLGAILHLAGDTITGKIPLLHPFKKTFGIRLFYTGSFMEYMFSAFLLVMVLILK